MTHAEKLAKIIGCSIEVAYDYIATLSPVQFLDLCQLLTNGTSIEVERFTGLAIPCDSRGKQIQLPVDVLMERAASKTMDKFLSIL